MIFYQLLIIAILVSSGFSTFWLIIDRLILKSDAMYADHGLRIAVTTFAWISVCFSTMLISYGFFSVFGLIAWLIVMGCVLTALSRQRDRYRRSLLKLLAAALKRRTPVGPMLEAFGHGVPPRYRRHIDRMRFFIEQGESITMAAQWAGRLVAKSDLALLAIGQRGGRLDLAVDMIIDVRRETTPLAMSVFGQIFYVLIILQAFLGIGSFIFMKIVPQFIKIFYSFDAELPMMTQNLIGVSNLIPPHLLALLFFISVVLLPILAVFLLLRMNEIIYWDPPGMRWIAWRLNRSSICRSLGLAMQLRLPMIESLQIMTDYTAKGYVRRRLVRALCLTAQGRHLVDSLRDSRLLYRSDLQVLAMAEKADSLDTAFLALADRRRQQVLDRTETVFQIGGPLIIGAFGIMVFFVTVGLFLPLVAMIQRLT